MGGVRVLFRVTDGTAIVRPWSCCTAVLVLLGMPGFWLLALGFWLTAGPGFAHWLAQLVLTMTALITAGLVVMCLCLIKPMRDYRRAVKKIEAERAAWRAALPGHYPPTRKP